MKIRKENFNQGEVEDVLTYVQSECDGQFYVSAGLACRVPRHLVKHCSGCVCEVFLVETNI